MKNVKVEQIYGCPFYKQVVTVLIRREICEKEICSKPQPHYTGDYFHDCSDILNCGVGEVVDGSFIANMTLCPAYMSLNIRKEEL